MVKLGSTALIDVLVIHHGRSPAVDFQIDMRHQFNAVFTQEAASSGPLRRCGPLLWCRPSRRANAVWARNAFTFNVLEDHPLDRWQADGQLLSHAFFTDHFAAQHLHLAEAACKVAGPR